MDLPEECWVNIFDFLFSDQKASIRRTCKSWNSTISLKYSEIIIDPSEPGYLLSKPLLHYSSAIEALANESGDHLTKLVIKGTLSCDLIIKLNEVCPNLATLRCGLLDFSCFALFDYKRLKNLTIKRFSDDFEEILNLEDSTIFENLNDLEELEISGLPSEQVGLLAKLPDSCCLRKLKIIEQGRKLQPFSNQQLHDLCIRPNSAQIKELHLVDCIFISQLRPLLSLKNLRKLYIPGCNSLKNGCGIEKITEPMLIGEPSLSCGLTTLCLSGLQRLSDFSFLHTMKHLRELNVEDCRHFMSESMNCLNPDCNLECLNISYSGAVNDPSLKILASLKYSLKVLKAENEDDAIYGITSTGVDLILENGGSLRTLSLSYNQGIDDSIFKALKNHHHKLVNLQNLDLYGINCTQPGFESFLKFRDKEINENGPVRKLKIGLMLNQYSRIKEELFAKANVEILRFINMRD